MTKISAGNYDLNKWLFGGYETDIITVSYGDSGTGKTNFCLLATVSQAKKGNKVIYIDTEGGFSSERIKQISLESYKEVLKNILLLKPTNFNEQKKAFEELLKSLKDEVSLIIVDGMTILYRLELASAKENNQNIQSINSELVKQMRTLAEIARKRDLPVLVTNQVYKWEEESKMVGGDILRYWGKCHILLENNNGKRSATLIKHRSLPQKRLDFEITESGLRKKGWI